MTYYQELEAARQAALRERAAAQGEFERQQREQVEAEKRAYEQAAQERRQQLLRAEEQDRRRLAELRAAQADLEGLQPERRRFVMRGGSIEAFNEWWSQTAGQRQAEKEEAHRKALQRQQTLLGRLDL